MEEVKEKPEWIKMKPQEVEKTILDLYKQGNSPEKIGLILRDKHGIPKTKTTTGKRIKEILIEAKIELPIESSIVLKKIEKTSKHITKHKHDYTAKRSLTKKLWIVKKLKKQELTK